MEESLIGAVKYPHSPPSPPPRLFISSGRRSRVHYSVQAEFEQICKELHVQDKLERLAEVAQTHHLDQGTVRPHEMFRERRLEVAKAELERLRERLEQVKAENDGIEQEVVAMDSKARELGDNVTQLTERVERVAQGAEDLGRVGRGE